MSFLRNAIIFLILPAFSIDLTEQYSYHLEMNIHREPPDSIEFKFNRNEAIKTISLQVDDVSFQRIEDKNFQRYRNPKPLSLHVNDRIKIRLGYRESGSEETKERNFDMEVRNSLDDTFIIRFTISPDKTPETSDATKKGTSTQPTNDAKEDDLNTDLDTVPVQQMDDMEDVDTAPLIEPEMCNNNEDHYDELLRTALGFTELEPTLLLQGLENANKNPVDEIRTIIVEDLELADLEFKILQAKFIDIGLLFEMQTTRDALEVLTKARLLLQENQSNLKIIPTKRSFFESFIDVRTSAK